MPLWISPRCHVCSQVTFFKHKLIRLWLKRLFAKPPSLEWEETLVVEIMNTQNADTQQRCRALQRDCNVRLCLVLLKHMLHSSKNPVGRSHFFMCDSFIVCHYHLPVNATVRFMITHELYMELIVKLCTEGDKKGNKGIKFSLISLNIIKILTLNLLRMNII